MTYHTLPNRQIHKPRLFGSKITHTKIKYIEADGKSLRDVFTKSLKGMAEILKLGVCSSAKHYNCSKDIVISADNRDQLLLTFLSNVLKLTATHKSIYCSINIKQLTEKKLIAQVFGVWFEELDYEIKSIVDGECIIHENVHEEKWKSSILFEIKKIN